MVKKKKVKKARKKKTAKKKPVKRKVSRTASATKVVTVQNASLEKALIENTIILQKVTTNLSVKFDNLSQKITKLLQLFELSAKTLAEKEFNIEQGDQNNQKIVERMDDLLEQNKVIARGLTLLHEKPTPGTSLPKPTQQPPAGEAPTKPLESKYQESISQRPRNENMAGV
tara:strand:+ start:145 stop:657 length:513 start_codon:yes stop_codon:yes gene_type:complete